MANETKKSTFDRLNAVNVNGHTEKKNGLTYLSWAWAWAEVKKVDPCAYFTIYENVNGWNFHTDGRTCWVKTGVTVEGLELIEYLPVMDMRNNSIPLEKVTSFDVNKAIQRSLTKACARHGLGLYIYAGEDLPEEVEKARVEAAKFPEAQEPAQQPKAAKKATKTAKKHIDTTCTAELDQTYGWLLSKYDPNIGDIPAEFYDRVRNAYDWQPEAWQGMLDHVRAAIMSK